MNCPVEGAASATTEETSVPAVPKARRMSYAKGEGLKKMSDALAAWDLELQKPKESRKSIHAFARERNIPFTTLQMHITTDESKRIKLGNGVGRKCIIGTEQQGMIVDMFAHKERRNEVVNFSEALDVLEQMCPESSRKQLDQSLRRTVLAKVSTASKLVKKSRTDNELGTHAPASLLKLYSKKVHGDVSKLTKKEICAIALHYFGRRYKELSQKPALALDLRALISAQPMLLPSALEAAAAEAPSIANPSEAHTGSR